MNVSRIAASTFVASIGLFCSIAHASFTPISQTGFVRSVGLSNDVTQTSPGTAPWQGFVSPQTDAEGGITSLDSTTNPNSIVLFGSMLTTRGLTLPGLPITAYSQFETTLTFSIAASVPVRADFNAFVGSPTSVLDSSFARLVRASDGQVLHSDGITNLILEPGIYRIEMGGELGNLTPIQAFQDDLRTVTANLEVIPAPASACVGLLGCAALLRRRR